MGGRNWTLLRDTDEDICGDFGLSCFFVSHLRINVVLKDVACGDGSLRRDHLRDHDMEFVKSALRDPVNRHSRYQDS